MKRLIVMIPMGFILWWLISSINKRVRDIQKSGVEDVDLRFTGVVDTVIKGKNYHAYGIIRVRVLESNVMQYDPRSSKKFYCCVLKNGMAEIYEHEFAAKVDSIFIDTKHGRLSYREDGKWIASDIRINSTEAYYDFVREKTIFK